jgi:hypothetical protein
MLDVMQQETLIRTRAREMAMTRQFRGWRSIEIALRADGYPKARSVLDDHFFRRELDALCQGKEPFDF